MALQRFWLLAILVVILFYLVTFSKMRVYVVLLALAVVASAPWNITRAQQQPHGQGTVPHTHHGAPCGTIDPELLFNGPDGPSYHQAEAINQQLIEAMQAAARGFKSAANGGELAPYDGDIYTIPVVVHVIHTGGNDSISWDQVYSQIIALNRDFRRWPGTIGFGEGYDSGIEFSLVTRDPQGNPHPGVNWVRSQLALHDYGDPALKNLIRWNQNRYLNIWIVNNIIGGTSGGQILGYATFPQPGGSTSDGLVILYNTFGTQGSLMGGMQTGRVATHEVGHWLNLYHTFQSGCGSACNNTGDRVCDTPPTADQNFGTAQRQNTCNNDSPDEGDQTRNYMDYTSDHSKDLFSEGQVLRMRAALENSTYNQRVNLWSESNLATVGAGKYTMPYAHFGSVRRTVSVGGQVQFYDFTFNQPNSWYWEFEGGSPATSTARNPLVTYNSPGVYKVRMVASNMTGSTDTLEFADYITVLNDVRTLPLVEDFEDPTFPPAGWHIHNPDAPTTQNSQRWNRAMVGSGFGVGSACVRISNYYYVGKGQVDDLVTPSLDFTGQDYPRLYWDIAYRPLFHQETNQFSRLYTDTLEVLVSTDFGTSWQSVYKRGGIQLATNGFTNSIFSPPAANQWRSDSLDLSAFTGQQVLVAFRNINGNGNHIYLDNIKVANASAPMVTVAETASVIQAVSLYPNPTTNGHLTVSWNQLQAADVHFDVFDASGRCVESETVAAAAPGNQRHTLHVHHLPSGIYNVRVSANGEFTTMRAVIR